MSFSHNVKEEIARNLPETDCCRHAMAYGMLLFAREFSSRGVSIMTDHDCVAALYSQMIEEECGVTARTKVSDAGKYSVCVDEEERQRVLSSFSVSGNEAVTRINRANLRNESEQSEGMNCCHNAFLKGAFLSCGTISDPQKSYHLEFVVPYRMLSFDLLKLLTEAGIKAKHMVRRYVNVIYVKDSDSIEELLHIMGASMSAFEITNIKIYKNFRNVSNRRTNFDEANTSRVAAAACEQIYAIRYLRESGAFHSLDPELQQIASLREENPDASLSDLGAMLSPPMTRSAVNHRLKKLVAYSEKAKETTN